MKRMFFKKIKDGFNRLRKNRVLYTFLTTALAFNLLIVASFAWLTLNRKTAVDEIGMGLAVDDTAAVYEAYMYDLEKGAGTDLNADGEKLNVTNIDLNQYDTIFKGQNKYTPVFAKIVLTRSREMPKSGKVYITVNRKTEIANEGASSEALSSEETADEGTLTDFTSSIVRFTGFIIPDKADLEIGKDLPEEEYATEYPKLLYDFINTKERFEDVENLTGQQANSKTFVTTIPGEEEGAHTHAKSDSLTIEVEYADTYWYTDENGNDAMNVYLYITYDPTLINCYMEGADDEISLDSNLIFFDNDMKEIKISYNK